MAKEKETIERIIMNVLVRNIYASEKDLSIAAGLISDALIAAGFTRVDPHMIDFFKVLSRETGDFAKSIKAMREEIKMFDLPLEKIVAIQSLIDHQEEKLTKKFERGIQDGEQRGDEEISNDETERGRAEHGVHS